MKELLSPKQVAASIGVSESSLKRWCDQGFLATERTPGGHRRIRVNEVIRFLRDQQRPLARPETLGLPSGVGQGPQSIERTAEALLKALIGGDSERARRLVIDQYLSGASVVTICEALIAPAMHALGDGWECGRVEVYQEHRASEALNRTLYDLRSMLPPPADSAPMAIGGTPPGDEYRLATLMVELVLVDEGWDAVSLGSSLPFATMAAAAQRHAPDLFWVSLSHSDDPARLRAELADFLRQVPPATRVVVGGRLADQVVAGLRDATRVTPCGSLGELRRHLGDLRPGH